MRSCATSRTRCARRAAISASASRATSKRAASRLRRSSAASARRPASGRARVVRVMPTGKVEVLTGSHSHGQGHETAFAQVVADELQVPMGDITIVHGDTGKNAVRLGHRTAAAAPPSACRRIKLAAGQDPRQGHAHRRAPARSRARGRRVRRRQVPGEGRARSLQVVVRRLAAGAPRATTCPRASSPDSKPATSTIRRTSSIRSARTSRSSKWIADTGARTLRRYVAVDDCGPAHQPADRRRPAARRRGARHGPGAARGGAPTTIRRSSRPARSSSTRCRAPTICRRSSSITR